MAAPTVNARQTGNSGTTAGYFHVVTLPADIVAGERLFVAFGVDGNSPLPIIDKYYSGHGWRKTQSGQSSTQVHGCLFSKIAEGGGLDRLRIVTDAAELSSWVSMRLSSDAQCFESASATGSSTNSNPPDLALTCGSPTPEVLWIAVRIGDDTDTPSAAPADFADLTNSTAPSGAGATVSTAERTLTAASLDPGVFTVATEQWVAFTVGFYADSSNVPSARVTALAVEVLTSNDNLVTATGGQYVIAT